MYLYIYTTVFCHILLFKNAVKTVMLWSIIITIWNNCFLIEYTVKGHLFLWCAAEFSASLLQSSESRDSSEIIIICWFAAHLLSIINSAQLITVLVIASVENKSYCLIYLCIFSEWFDE